MGRIRDMIGGGSLEALVLRARRKLATGDLDQAHRMVERGLERYPGAQVLRDLELSIRRAQVRQGMQHLRERIAETNEARAYEELIGLYLEMGLHAEARGEAMAYARAHPDQDNPHLLLGELGLQDFFQDLLARDAQAAHHRLQRAARLNREATKPRLLLAELYYAVGADRSLARMADELAQIAPDDPLLEPLLQQMRVVARPDARESLDGLFAQVEVDGQLLREATGWPMHRRRREALAVDAAQAQGTVDALVERGDAEEVVLLHRSGTFLARASAAPGTDDASAPPDGSDAPFVDVTRTVARTISRYVRELEIGAFRRCGMEGEFGLATVGQLGNVVAGARWTRAPDPHRRWDRVAVGVEGSLGVRP